MSDSGKASVAEEMEGPDYMPAHPGEGWQGSVSCPCLPEK